MTSKNMSDVAAQAPRDLAAARAAVTFSPETVRLGLLYPEPSSHPLSFASKQRLLDLLLSDPVLSNIKRSRFSFSRPQRLERGLIALRAMVELGERERLSHEEQLRLGQFLEESPISLHDIAFVPVIRGQGSEKQKEEWLGKALRKEILGCYLQTELGHGTSVRHLETTATYDPSKDAFIINSPTLTSAKWWIGAAGVIATHGVVQAQLHLPVARGAPGETKNCGPHLFIVPLRDPETSTPLPGIIIGDIGPKAYGMGQSLDNGFARFDHVVLDRSMMLSGFSKVLPVWSGGEEGKGTIVGAEYQKGIHEKLAYGGMIFIRANLVESVGLDLARGATIAVRYCTVRRQSAPSSQSTEGQVIRYPSVYMRILPSLAHAYATIILGKGILDNYRALTQVLDRVVKGEGEVDVARIGRDLADMHALSAGFKAYSAELTTAGLERCRRALGGHGMSAYAGIGYLVAHQMPGVTYEGDNYVLFLQVARSALKSFSLCTAAPRETTLTSSSLWLRFMSSSPPISQTTAMQAEDWFVQAENDGNPSLPVVLLSHRACRMVSALATSLLPIERGGEGKTWEQVSWEACNVGRAVTEATAAEQIERHLRGVKAKGTLNVQEEKVVGRLIRFYLLDLLLGDALPSLLTFSLLPQLPSPSSGSAPTPSPASHPLLSLRAAHALLAKRLLPEAVGLVDAFGFSDFELDSAVGANDGDAYKRLWNRAVGEEPINAGLDGLRGEGAAAWWSEDQKREGAAWRKRVWMQSIKPILETGKRIGEREKREGKPKL